MLSEFTCTKCNLHIILTGTHLLGTGYGIDKEGNKVCYHCCGQLVKADMDERGRAVLYLTIPDQSKPTFGLQHYRGRNSYILPKGSTITNWPGTLEYPATVQVSPRGHNWGLKRYDVWFRDYQDKPWHGVTYGDNTQLCHCKRLKHDWR